MNHADKIKRFFISYFQFLIYIWLLFPSYLIQKVPQNIKYKHIQCRGAYAEATATLLQETQTCLLIKILRKKFAKNEPKKRCKYLKKCFLLKLIHTQCNGVFLTLFENANCLIVLNYFYGYYNLLISVRISLCQEVKLQKHESVRTNIGRNLQLLWMHQLLFITPFWVD